MINPKQIEQYPFLCSWSGGKDSYLACLRARETGSKPVVLLNNLNEFGDRSRSHGIPRTLLEKQAQACELPIDFTSTSWQNYEEHFVNKLLELKERYVISYAVYGDIDIQSHRDWEEKVSQKAGLEAVLPLWQENRLALVQEMINSGIEALIVSCRAEFANDLLGKVIDTALLSTFEELGIDACGENGEYHTLVVNGPLHKNRLEVIHDGFSKHKHYAFLNIDL